MPQYSPAFPESSESFSIHLLCGTILFPVKPDRFALVAQMIFDTKEDLDNALQSGERAIAREDFSSFPPFHGVVYHQATISEEVFSK
jgi:hypothetical protein